MAKRPKTADVIEDVFAAAGIWLRFRFRNLGKT